MSFINDNFMLHGKTAERLFHEYAENMPILDYHCHLSPAMIARDYRFKNIAELMLGGDHYKWRAMRSNGVEEQFITGDADDFEKFMAWAETVPYTIGNPLYHWTHLELKRYFGIDEVLCPETAESIWNRCNELLQTNGFSVRGLIQRSNVEIVCTTDDPADDLCHQKQIAQDGFPVRVLPAFRPDNAVELTRATFLPYLEKIGVASFDELCRWLTERIGYFHENGCRIADHALVTVPYAEGDAAKIFDKAVNGGTVSAEEEAAYKTAVLSLCAQEYAKRGWAMQMHIGTLKNANSAMLAKLGADTGFDSICDRQIAETLAKFLDALDREDSLPKTILYTLNPKDNYVLATMLGNFQRGPVKGKIQFGSGWWFNDQRDGMESQMKALANCGLISRFIGMLTDSRSFISYPRHEYFRRILCNLLGKWVDDGEYPADFELLGTIVRGICFENAKAYFNL